MASAPQKEKKTSPNRPPQIDVGGLPLFEASPPRDGGADGAFPGNARRAHESPTAAQRGSQTPNAMDRHQASFNRFAASLDVSSVEPRKRGGETHVRRRAADRKFEVDELHEQDDSVFSGQQDDSTSPTTPHSVVTLHVAKTEPQRIGPTFGLFGGLERTSCFDELAKLLKTKSSTCRSLNSFITYSLNSFVHAVPAAAPLKDALLCGGTSPALDDTYFAQPIISWPLNTIMLAASYAVCVEEYGFDLLFGMLKRGGIFTSGKGIFAALAVAQSASLEDFTKTTEYMVQLSCTVGAVYQQHAELLSWETDRCRRKSYNLLVVNVPIASLQEFVSRCNEIDLAAHNGQVPLSQMVISRGHQHEVCRSVRPSSRLKPT